MAIENIVDYHCSGREAGVYRPGEDQRTTTRRNRISPNCRTRHPKIEGFEKYDGRVIALMGPSSDSRAAFTMTSRPRPHPRPRPSVVPGLNGIPVYGETELLDQIGTNAAAIAVRTAPSATHANNSYIGHSVACESRVELSPASCSEGFHGMEPSNNGLGIEVVVAALSGYPCCIGPDFHGVIHPSRFSPQCGGDLPHALGGFENKQVWHMRGSSFIIPNVGGLKIRR
ncbi:uncharacterized protein BO96DRAFT_435170 [Aspergillus niger CBS 101883]|uniref:Uncharacterized protein n=2 Tax=Aspergillus niger TaxID=5061 RepID=A2R5Y6_ASPNC|nr:uncharacterized protein BO96DRAFT_435170 [Aspergillus niger CBS 101883]XP_059602591.1 hypothetical protein An15g06000 [Aspergillus niger]PYH55297.1 hypothetical protein BO96DRAFT_435170 [Aspergillus niger CBS 101883]CAK42553.1 hypothetical protein An15g06000 [Aspergillus niger]